MNRWKKENQRDGGHWICQLAKSLCKNTCVRVVLEKLSRICGTPIQQPPIQSPFSAHWVSELEASSKGTHNRQNEETHGKKTTLENQQGRNGRIKSGIKSGTPGRRQTFGSRQSSDEMKHEAEEEKGENKKKNSQKGTNSLWWWWWWWWWRRQRMWWSEAGEGVEKEDGELCNNNTRIHTSLCNHSSRRWRNQTAEFKVIYTPATLYRGTAGCHNLSGPASPTWRVGVSFCKMWMRLQQKEVGHSQS